MKKIIIALCFFLPLSMKATLINMVALEKAAIPDKGKLALLLQEDWGLEIDSMDIEGSDKSLAFNLQGETIGFMLMDFAIPWQEIEGPCQYSPTWDEASAEMKKHKSHLIVTIISQKNSLIERELLLNKLVASSLKLTESIGVYIGRAQLVRSKGEFLMETERIRARSLPVGNWLFFGITETKKGNAGFTVGLENFGYREMEILESEKSLGDIYVLFYNTSHYVIAEEVVFKNKETLGYTKTQKLPIRIKKSTVAKGKKVVLIDY
ncbi:MAG: DUF4261 domain-containing protein [Bacteroidota bacterium]